MDGSNGPAVPHLSVVIPLYKAEDCVAELCRRVRQAALSITNDFEIILVDDRSPDASWTLVTEEASNDARIRGIRLARNFGQHRAITAGLDHARGDWVVVMDCDLQDAPEDIPLLYKKALEGYEMVLARFDEPSPLPLRRRVSKFFWETLSWLAGIRFDHRIGNFRIMSRRVVTNFCAYREQLRFLGGITALMGFTTASIPLQRAERYAGSTSYTFSKLLATAMDITVAYSDKPLKISVAMGTLISVVSFLGGIAILLLALQGSITVPGWASVMISLYFLGGLIIANLGIIGYYLGKVFDESKRRPLYVTEATLNEPTVGKSFADLGAREVGKVIWITGLSGAGKSTLAKEVVAKLKALGQRAILLDGDDIREVFGATESNLDHHDLSHRRQLALKYSQLCRLIASQGATVVIATISMFKDIHQWNRANLPNYFEVYLKVPMSELHLRDPKGIYLRFEEGSLRHVAGLDLPVDEPEHPDWTVEFNPAREAPEIAIELIERLKVKV